MRLGTPGVHRADENVSTTHKMKSQKSRIQRRERRDTRQHKSAWCRTSAINRLETADWRNDVLSSFPTAPMSSDSNVEPEDVPGALMTATRAKSRYGLNERDLDALDCLRVPNPHFRDSAAPMRLYEVEQLVSLSKRKIAQKEAAARAKPELLRAKKEAAKAQAAEAADVVRPFKESKAASAAEPLGGDSPLSIHAWALVLRAVAFTDPLRDVCLAARDVCQAAGACRDMRLGAKHVLHELAATVRPQPSPQAVALVTAPTTLTVPSLKAVCSGELKVAVSGTKPKLILRALHALGLQRPDPQAPMALLLEARRQRKSRVCSGDYQFVCLLVNRAQAVTQYDDPLYAQLRMRSDLTVWQARRFVAERFSTWASLLEAEAEAWAAQARALELAAEHKRRQALFACGCGNTIARECLHRLCGKCCTDLNCIGAHSSKASRRRRLRLSLGIGNGSSEQ